MVEVWIELAAPNPIGDAHHFPLDGDDIEAKLARLIRPADTARIVGAVARLPGAPDARPVLAAIALDQHGENG